MSLQDDYLKQLIQLTADVNNVVHTKMADTLLESITNSARHRVYEEYSPDVYERRGSFLDKSQYGVQRGPLSVSVEALQAGNSAYENYYPGHIVNIVENGGPWQWQKKNGDLPGPRPFMQEGLNDYINGGFADADLAEGLRARGYIVTE
jgi:hypothetical protein